MKPVYIVSWLFALAISFLAKAGGFTAGPHFGR